MRLSELAALVNGALHGADCDVTGVAVDSRRARAGDLFVAIRGRRAIGSQFIDDAAANGAVAVCDVTPHSSLPSIVVEDPRAAAPYLAAAAWGHPAREMTLIGVSGTFGKTSTALLIQSALASSGVEAGVIGSLGVHLRGSVAFASGMTTPDVPALHAALRHLRDSNIRTAILEVTTHAIRQHRVSGLTFALGVFTNLVPDEHLEFHPTPEDYIRTKIRFFDMLEPGAPLVANADDPLVREVVSRLERPIVWVSRQSGDASSDAHVEVSGLRADGGGSSFVLHVRRSLPQLDGGELSPRELPVILPVLGVQQVANATFAATAALVAGASPERVTEGLADHAPMRRRMQVLRMSSPLVIDDTVGHPSSLDMVFETISPMPRAHLRIAFGIRGARGLVINERLAQSLAQHVRSSGAILVVTSSEDRTQPSDAVQPGERDTFLEVLQQQEVPFHYEPTLERAVRRAMDGCTDDDLILLLGAQGMDGAAEVAMSLLEERDSTRHQVQEASASA